MSAAGIRSLLTGLCCIAALAIVAAVYAYFRLN
jgi:hypothetical protein